MNTKITTFNYEDDTFKQNLNVLEAKTQNGMHIDIKLGDIENKKVRLSRIVRIIMCNKIIPEFIAKNNIDQAEKQLRMRLNGEIEQAKFKIDIPGANFIIKVYVNNKIITYTGNLQVVNSNDVKYSIGFSYGLRNRDMNIYDCTEYKPFTYTLQNTVKRELQKRLKNSDISLVGLNTKTGVCNIQVKNDKLIKKKPTKFIMSNNEFPSLISRR
jgi:hypothetical protein